MFYFKSESNLNENFTIEENIIKGVKKTYNIKEKSMGEIILKSFNENPDHIGQIEAETGRQSTFTEMKENSIRCALWMQKQGMKSGDVIGLCTHNHLDTYIPFIATFFIGAIQNSWHHEITLKNAQYFMSLTKPKIMFACESIINILITAAKLENIEVKFIVFGKHAQTKSLKDILKLQTEEEVLNYKLKEIDNPKDIALILFSSGTTGLSKGVQHSYESILKNTIKYLFQKERKYTFLWYSSLYWISGTLSMFQSIITVATRLIHANFDPDETCKYIEKFKVNVIFFNPEMITYLCKSNALKKYDLTSVKMIVTGGSKLAYKFLEEFKMTTNIPIIQAYGMTEIGSVTTIQTAESKSIESVGFVVQNIDLKIVDLINNQALGSNKIGELCIKSASKMVGYLNNLAATREIIDDEDWLHSGDMAYYSKEGELFIIDRIKEVMKVSGHHVSPSEIEEVLIGHPAVMEAVVVPVLYELCLQKPMAFIKKNPGMEVTEDELVKLSSELGKYKTLTGGIKFLDEIPHTASGKVHRKKVKEMAKAYTN